MTFSDLRTLTLIRIFRSRFVEDICFLLAVTLAAGFYVYEKRLPYADYIMQVLAVSVIILWLRLSFTSGFMRRIHFMFFVLSYWIIPHIIIIAYASGERYDPLFHALSRISGFLVRSPLDFISQLFNTDVFLTGIILLVLCLTLFVFGFYFRGKCREYRWYNIFREQYNI